MIIDKIENSKLYSLLSPGIEKAFEYLQNTDLVNTPCGKYSIDGDKVFAIVQEFITKHPEEGKLEGHFKYIDIQYIIKGSEQIGMVSLNHQKPIEINIEKDYAFYKDEVSFVTIPEKSFAVFFPDDLHMPGIKNQETAFVKKVVIKIEV